MAINYPTSIDTFTNPTPSDNLDTPSVLHTDQHANINDAVTALETKVGVNDSTDASSLDFRSFQLMPALTAPDNTQFTWVNQGSVTLDLTGPGILLTAPDQNSDDAVHLRTKPVIGATFTLTALVHVHIYPNSYSNVGIGLRDSGSGKLVYIGLAFAAGGVGFFLIQRPSPTSANDTNIDLRAPNYYHHQVWFRITVDSTNATYYYSFNGRDFLTVYQEAKNNYLPAITDTWFGVDNYSSGQNAYMRLLSWNEV